MTQIHSAAIAILLAACSVPALAAAQSAAATSRDSSAVRREPKPTRTLPRELPTKWTPPPGSRIEHEVAGFAKVLCSALFVTGRTLKEAAAEDGFFISPAASRATTTDTIVDRTRQSVTVHLKNGIARTARRFGDQGCVILPAGEDSVHFTPHRVVSALPDGANVPWPMGDRVDVKSLPAEIDKAALIAATNAAFAPDSALTAAWVVLYKGRIIAERYRAGIDANTRLPGWSMGKSVTATVLATLIQEKYVGLWDAAPIPEWQSAGDARQQIRIADIVRMSSGLRFVSTFDPNYEPAMGYPDHLYVYTGAIDAFKYAATRPQQWAPNTVGLYRNTDPLLVNYIIRRLVEAKGEDYFSSWQHHLFDKIGVRRMTLETDPYGNFLLMGFDFAPARDFARIAQLYLQDGVWDGERLLPKGWRDFTRTPAPAWPGKEYGGMWWLNRNHEFPVPADAFSMQGVGGQTTLVIPTHDLVVVRMGHFKGTSVSDASLAKALTLLMKAVPQRHRVWQPPAGAR